jgi:hypothetical protein
MALISQNYFGIKLYMLRTEELSIIRSLFTVHSEMIYVIHFRRQLLSSSILVLFENCLQKSMRSTIAECTVNNLLMMDRRTVRTCRVSWQNKFARLVHLVGFIIKKLVTGNFCFPSTSKFTLSFHQYFVFIQTLPTPRKFKNSNRR